jgi:Flp pilus assembly protein TadB
MTDKLAKLPQWAVLVVTAVVMFGVILLLDALGVSVLIAIIFGTVLVVLLGRHVPKKRP